MTLTAGDAYCDWFGGLEYDIDAVSSFCIIFRQTQGGEIYPLFGQDAALCVHRTLAVYCLRNVRFDQPANIVPELVAVLSIVILHYRKENALLSMGVGTAKFI